MCLDLTISTRTRLAVDACGQDCKGGCFDSAAGAAGNVSPDVKQEYGVQVGDNLHSFTLSGVCATCSVPSRGVVLPSFALCYFVTTPDGTL